MAALDAKAAKAAAEAFKAEGNHLFSQKDLAGAIRAYDQGEARQHALPTQPHE